MASNVSVANPIAGTPDPIPVRTTEDASGNHIQHVTGGGLTEVTSYAFSGTVPVGGYVFGSSAATQDSSVTYPFQDGDGYQSILVIAHTTNTYPSYTDYGPSIEIQFNTSTTAGAGNPAKTFRRWSRQPGQSAAHFIVPMTMQYWRLNLSATAGTTNFFCKVYVSREPLPNYPSEIYFSSQTVSDAGISLEATQQTVYSTLDAIRDGFTDRLSADNAVKVIDSSGVRGWDWLNTSSEIADSSYAPTVRTLGLNNIVPGYQPVQCGILTLVNANQDYQIGSDWGRQFDLKAAAGNVGTIVVGLATQLVATAGSETGIPLKKGDFYSSPAGSGSAFYARASNAGDKLHFIRMR